MNVAFIPVRGGSKSIPLKNIKPIAGKPLVYWVVKAACQCTSIDKVYISTDSEKIANVVQDFKNEIEGKLFTNKIFTIERGAETASDTASTESAMLEFAGKYEFTNIVLIQATSPLLQSSDLDRGFQAFEESECDSVLSVVRQKRFVWEIDDKGMAHSLNYDYSQRPRRQEFEGYLVENGAFYIISRENLLKDKNRLSGKIRAVEMDEESYYEIDEPTDFGIVESLLLKRRQKNEKHDKSRKIKMFLTDCDGCLTDGGMYYSEKGDELKKFNARDGKGFEILHENNIITGIITGENVEINKRRAEKLKVDVLAMGVKDKRSYVIELCKKHGVDLQDVVYVGDDINDLEVLSIVGFPCSVRNAHEEVKKKALYVSEKNGGEGAIREIIDHFVDIK